MNAMHLQKLPLQGSNLDSPDPESDAPLAHRETPDALGRQFATVSASAHTNPHTIRHTSPWQL